jgi:putative toxin-antitoxin system antitoxin component (TIGR02293 family)
MARGVKVKLRHRKRSVPTRRTSSAVIIDQAKELLGTRQEVEVWLRRPAVALNSRRPLDLLGTPDGRELLRTLLSRLDHGVYT